MIFLIIFGFTIIISYFWVNAIDNMKKIIQITREKIYLMKKITYT